MSFQLNDRNRRRQKTFISSLGGNSITNNNTNLHHHHNKRMNTLGINKTSMITAPSSYTFIPPRNLENKQHVEEEDAMEDVEPSTLQRNDSGLGTSSATSFCRNHSSNSLFNKIIKEEDEEQEEQELDEDDADSSHGSDDDDDCDGRLYIKNKRPHRDIMRMEAKYDTNNKNSKYPNDDGVDDHFSRNCNDDVDEGKLTFAQIVEKAYIKNNAMLALPFQKRHLLTSLLQQSFFQKLQSAYKDLEREGGCVETLFGTPISRLQHL
eukprot:m.4747 g.4747  ORF g.4747 m.4747 type:complete len:265 (+) comp3969_c0_seq1:492-1286(+)